VSNLDNNQNGWGKLPPALAGGFRINLSIWALAQSYWKFRLKPIQNHRALSIERAKAPFQFLNPLNEGVKAPLLFLFILQI